MTGARCWQSWYTLIRQVFQENHVKKSWKTKKTAKKRTAIGYFGIKFAILKVNNNSLQVKHLIHHNYESNEFPRESYELCSSHFCNHRHLLERSPQESVATLPPCQDDAPGSCQVLLRESGRQCPRRLRHPLQSSCRHHFLCLFIVFPDERKLRIEYFLTFLQYLVSYLQGLYFLLITGRNPMTHSHRL